MRQNRCQSFVWPMAVTTILTLLSLAGTAAGDVQTVRTVVHQSIGTSQSKEGSLNDEAAALVMFQRAYQAAARTVAIVDDLLELAVTL